MKILINGRAGAGKDEVADYLVAEYGFKKLSFASKIYDIARDIFGMRDKDRQLLQQIGQKLREIDPDVWVKHTFKEAAKYEKVVISDCRQENEYKMGIKRGFYPVRVKADISTRKQRLIDRDGVNPRLELLENKCETGADQFKYYEIDNNDDLKSLYSKIDKLIQEL